MRVPDNETFPLMLIRNYNFFSLYTFGNWLKCIRLYFNIKYRKWIDMSGKKDPPPDFYNPKLKMMMEVYRTDDCAYINEKGKVINKTIEKEHQILRDTFGFDYKKDESNIPVFMSVTSGLPSKEDHTFARYLESFKRNFLNHYKHLENYQRNHPGYKTVFFIFDESHMYTELESHSGILLKGKPHWCFWDYEFVNTFANTKIDYVVWIIPYKYVLKENKRELKIPKIAIYDIKSIKMKRLYRYNHAKMESLESADKYCDSSIKETSQK